jgi:hypothetical protein
MNIYKIKIDDKYLAGFSNETVAQAHAGGWYDSGKDVKGLVLVDDIAQAMEIDGNINLKSYFNRIYEIIRYSKFSFNELTIEKVGEE